MPRRGCTETGLRSQPTWAMRTSNCQTSHLSPSGAVFAQATALPAGTVLRSTPSASFAAPFVQGKVFDAAVDAYHRGAGGGHAFSHTAPLLAVIGGLCDLVALGDTVASCSPCRRTPLSPACAVPCSPASFSKMSPSMTHVSGELSSRLINEAASCRHSHSLSARIFCSRRSGLLEALPQCI